MTIGSSAGRPALDDAVMLILGVARLGEADLAGWWGSHGLDAVGRYVLRRAFKRTWQVAALELDILSASRRHDEAADGRATALHLFCDELPFRRWAAAWLADQKARGDRGSIFGELESWNLAEARTSLLRWAGCEPAPEVVGHGLLLGELSPAELRDEQVLLSSARLLAACYPAIDSPFRVPYFNLRS
ncbi:MAG TPA: BrxE family protein [Streptosporangiaceae bacterium]|nr:BrxE family protein [Streptosporangiaceae bacterium]